MMPPAIGSPKPSGTDAALTNTLEECDVIVVGGGNAALCAALAAREHCQRVLVLERAPADEAGGNSRSD